jgi:hypothetical protein
MIRNDSYDTPEDPPCTMCPNLMPCQWCPHHPPTRQTLLGKQPLRQEPPPGLSKDLCLHVIRRSKASSMGEKDKHPPSKYDTLHGKKKRSVWRHHLSICYGRGGASTPLKTQPLGKGYLYHSIPWTADSCKRNKSTVVACRVALTAAL